MRTRHNHPTSALALVVEETCKQDKHQVVARALAEGWTTRPVGIRPVDARSGQTESASAGSGTSVKEGRSSDLCLQQVKAEY